MLLSPHLADDRVEQVREQRSSKAQDQQHKSEVQAHTSGGSDLIGIDVFRNLSKSQRCNDYHAATQHDKEKPGNVANQLVDDGGWPPRKRTRSDFQEQVKLLDQKAECHDRYRRPYPRQERALIRGVVAVAVDH